VISDRNGELLAATAKELTALGDVTAVEGDVRSMADAGTMVQRTVEAYGSLDILVCNAGITSVMPIEQLEEDEWDRVLETNAKGMFTLIKHAIPHMKAAGAASSRSAPKWASSPYPSHLRTTLVRERS